jgi:hypothetical protein
MELIKNVWSDEKIYQAAKAEWVGILTQLWTAIGQPIDKARLDVYIKQLSMMPMAILETVINKLMERHDYHTVPTIGEIWRMTWLIMGNSAKEDTDMDHLKWQLANWAPAPRVDKYAEISAALVDA